MRIACFLALCSALVLGSVLLVSCSGDDDDDDSGDDSGDDTDDDASSDGPCTQETLCQFAVDCGFYSSVEQCVADSGGCADEAGQVECSCACLSESEDCETGFNCGAGCVETYC